MNETVIRTQDPSTGTETATITQTTYKCGHMTTEFWLSLPVVLAGMFLVVWGAIKGDTAIITIGGGLAGLPSGAYSLSRGLAKRS